MTTARRASFRQARRTSLNTIVEERESQYSKSDAGDEDRSPLKSPSPPQLKLQTSGLLSIPKPTRQPSPLSIESASSCSDTEWQDQMQGLDELYDATDDESESSDDCMCSEPASAATPVAKKDVSASSVPRKQCMNLTIPPSNALLSVQPNKKSPVPPTPPPKIPVSPAALSLLSRSVPAAHAPPSLDGSVPSDQVSSASSPATPDLPPVPDQRWNAEDVPVRFDLNSDDEHEHSDSPNIEISIDDTNEDWGHVLGSFPAVPSRAQGPSTPLSLDLDAEPAREPTPCDRGIDLPEGAMDILRHIPLNGTPEPWSETSTDHEEMWEVDPSQNTQGQETRPGSALSGYSFSSLSIPSPGGFFAALTPRARHTWSLPGGNVCPTSTTAADFYNVPFDRHEDGNIVEQVVECPERPAEEDGELTAVPTLQGPPTAVRIPPEVTSPVYQDSPVSPGADVNEIPGSSTFSSIYEYDENYHKELQTKALASFDRTSIWLAAQDSYLAALRDTNPANSTDDESRSNKEAIVGNKEPGRASLESSREPQPVQLPEASSSQPSATASKDSIYWRGFKHLRQCSRPQDAFVHRNMRFDAIQSNRLGLTTLHSKRLSGHYDLAPHERPGYKGPFSQAPGNSTLESTVAEKAQFSLLEKEQLVLAQIKQSMWAIDALRYLNGGRLLVSPASQSIAKAAIPSHQKNNRRVRVLDLGGHATCEWGWYLAHDNPNVSVYTVFTKQQKVNPSIKGPANHKQTSVEHLWELPFGNSTFDVISARSLPALLKTERSSGQEKDEYDLCLQECYRCLKPGGYLEFFTMDAEIMRGGPLASATSVEFAFNLKARGYDASPTKSILSRLRTANLVGIKRAWSFLPMGVEPVQRRPPVSGKPVPGLAKSKHIASQFKTDDAPLASTGDIASVTGLFGGWMWEQWLLKLQMEMGRDGDRLLDGIGGVFDEGRKSGAGWTCLSGWAMKPKPKQNSSHGRR